MVSTELVRTILLPKLSLRTKRQYIKWLAGLRCLVWQSHVWSTVRNIVFGIVLHSLGLLCRADDYLSNLECPALRAMTGHEGESAVMLFVVFSHPLKPCGAIQNFACFPKVLPLVVVLSFPKGVANGPGYIRLYLRWCSIQPVDRSGMVIALNKIVSTELVRTILLHELSLLTKHQYIKLLVGLRCLVWQSHVWSTVRNMFLARC